jgi:hypothetical protein
MACEKETLELFACEENSRKIKETLFLFMQGTKEKLLMIQQSYKYKNGVLIFFWNNNSSIHLYKGD